MNAIVNIIIRSKELDFSNKLWLSECYHNIIVLSWIAQGLFLVIVMVLLIRKFEGYRNSRKVWIVTWLLNSAITLIHVFMPSQQVFDLIVKL